MSANWTLLYNQTEKTLAQWNITGITKTISSGQSDLLAFQIQEQDALAAPTFPYGSAISVKRNGVGWFQGSVTAIPSYAGHDSEQRSYKVAGPWMHLEDLVFHQQWATVSGPKWKTRVVLGQSSTGLSQNSSATLSEILTFAKDTANRPFLIGTIDANITHPFDECKDISCAEAIRKVMRWNPDCVIQWDYSTTPHPTIHIRKVANLSTWLLDAANHDIESIQISPRDDLKRDSVVIYYERAGSTLGSPWTDIATDKYPTNATGFEERALSLTLPLEGGSRTFVHQTVRVRPIQETTLPEAAAYWKKIHPLLNDPGVTNLTFHTIPNTSLTFQRTLPDDEDGQITLDSSLPNELVEGSITDWMQQPPHSIQAQIQTLQARISYTLDGTPVAPHTISHTFTATDATSRKYSLLDQFDTGEPVPVGLAQAFYNALNRSQLEGSLSTLSHDAPLEWSIGTPVDCSQFSPQWSSYRGTIQKVETNPETGRTVYFLGPATPLAPHDLADLLRVTTPSFRGRVNEGRSDSSTYRATHKTSWGLGNKPALGNTTSLSLGSSTHPFQGIIANETGPSVAKVQVRYGTVSGGAPTISGSPLTTDLATNPKLATPTTGKVYLKLTLNSSGVITARAIEFAAAVPSDSSTLAHILLFDVTVVSDQVTAIAQSVTNSLNHGRRCWDQHFFWGV